MTTTNLTKVYKSKTKSQTFYDTETVKMSIDMNAMSHIIDRLTQLYSVPLDAAIREIVSNAIDATKIKQQNSNKPVGPVKLEIDPYTSELKISDSGIGMTKEDIVNIYSKYGASTKKLDLNTIGAYGLGAKAPLAYTDSFTITTRKDGEETIGIITKTENGPEIKIIHNGPTSEDSGTSIEFLVKDDKDKRVAIERFQRYYYLRKMITVEIEVSENLKTYNKKKWYQDSKDKSIDLTMPEKSNVPLIIKYDNGEEIKLDYYLSPYLNKKIKDVLNRNYEVVFVLEGYDYHPDLKYYNKDGDFSNERVLYVNLIPGILDFDSSRDKILENERLTFLKKSIENNFYENFPIPSENNDVYFIKDLIWGVNNKIISPEFIKDKKINNVNVYDFYNEFKDYKADKLIALTTTPATRADLCPISPLKIFSSDYYFNKYFMNNNWYLIDSKEETILKFTAKISKKLDLPILFAEPEVIEKFKKLGIKKEVLSAEQLLSEIRTQNKIISNSGIKTITLKFDETETQYNKIKTEELSLNEFLKLKHPILFTYEKHYWKYIYGLHNSLKLSHDSIIYVVCQEDNKNLFQKLNKMFKENKNKKLKIYYEDYNYWRKNLSKGVKDLLFDNNARLARQDDSISPRLNKEYLYIYLMTKIRLEMPQWLEKHIKSYDLNKWREAEKAAEAYPGTDIVKSVDKYKSQINSFNVFMKSIELDTKKYSNLHKELELFKKDINSQLLHDFKEVLKELKS